MSILPECQMKRDSRELMSSKRFGGLLPAASLLIGLGVATVSAVWEFQEPKLDKAASQPPDAQAARQEEELIRAGEETIERACIQCHPWEQIVRMRRTGREWQDMITTMAARGAPASAEQLAIIQQYLTRYYGVVAVNTSSAEELSAVLGLSSKDAQAIVQHRKAHGKFADAAALASVPGIDKTKIDEQPEALRFNQP
jgi:competence ComEA-like helix-hairpin-helix protein